MRLSGTHLEDLRRVLGLLEFRVCGVGGVDGGDWIGICLFFMIERGLSFSESIKMVRRNWNFQVYRQQNSLQPRKRERGGGRVQ